VFAERLAGMRESMYRVSCSQLKSGFDREDAVQETLLKAWNNRHKLRNEQYMQTWVTRILINECKNIHRKHKRETAVSELQEHVSVGDTSVEANSELYEALFNLSVKLRLPLILHYIEGYTTREIAKILNIPRGTVLWRMSKARKELGLVLHMDEHGEDSHAPMAPIKGD